ncbi:hypothetical protein NBH00_18795 [Paraconexibacter antarcticus]|uniref:ABC transporter ATP-binding protein n=1 Tax=Paraconexibacter antarcticus TaxID=2949664 RepID=A0ABY5E0T5_9ACTN|nr:hypothetical protein [Paraconexibacter antarcticus]UTI67126.1 hypothetical protein NBH00_18795 [Paraconexibacter antarcticus]
MLIRLLKEHLGRYRRRIVVVVALEFVSTIAALYLPTLNADIIDNGVVTGDTGYITRTGAIRNEPVSPQCGTGRLRPSRPS